ncbi:MAG: TerB family tellurite resistance protein [Bacteroidales bacterium]
MASADGRITAEEKEFAKKYFYTLYPESFAHVLFEEFEEAFASGINTDKILSSIDRRLNNDDKVFLLVKLIELMTTDEVHESERKVLDLISEKFGIPHDYTDFLLDLISGSHNDVLHNRSEYCKFLTISDDESDGDVFLPFTGLRLLVLNIGKSLIIVQIDKKNKVLINDKPIVPNFAFKIQKNSHIWIDNRYDISYQDLIYYFKNLQAPESSFYLEETNKDVEICQLRSDATMVLCEVEKCKIFLTPQKESKLYINGRYSDGRTIVNFADKIFWANYKINLRTLVFQSFFQISVETKLSIGNLRKFTIGNNLESTIGIDDELDKLWDCQD